MRSELKRGTVLTTGVGLTSALTLIFMVWAGRVLGPRDGADFFTFTFFYFLVYGAITPINHAIARFGAEAVAQARLGTLRAQFGSAIRIAALLGAALLGASFVLGGPLASIFRLSSVTLIPLGAVVVACALWVHAVRGLLRATQRYGTYAANLVLEALVRIGVGGTVLLISPDVVGAVAAFVAGLIVAGLVGSSQLRSYWRGSREVAFRPSTHFWRFAIPIFVLQGTSAFMQNSDMLYAKAVFDGSTAGLYGAAATLAKGIGTLATPFVVLVLPRLTFLERTGGDAPRALGHVLAQFLVLAVAALAVLGIWSTDILTMVFGGPFAAADTLVLPLAAAGLVGALALILGQALAAVDRFRFLVFFVVATVAEALAFATLALSPIEVVYVSFSVQLTALVGVSLGHLLAWRERRRG